MLLVTAWFAGSALVLLTRYARWRRLRAIPRTAPRVARGREADTLRRVAGTAGIRAAVELVSSDTWLEPGVFGILRPTVLWPRELSARLTDGQVDAILAHEVVHVRRRDNLSATAHRVVEALFWFHPVVWWLGARLGDEREQACDEDVIRLGADPQIYAESLLRACEFGLESPGVCVASAAGSDLKQRVERIMQTRPGDTLHGWRRALLVAAATAAIAMPVVIGATNPPSAQARGADGEGATFAFASVTPNTSGDLTFAPPRARQHVSGGCLRLVGLDSFVGHLFHGHEHDPARARGLCV